MPWFSLQHGGSLVSACELLSRGMSDSVSWPRMEPSPQAFGGWSLSHWTTREVPQDSILPTSSPSPTLAKPPRVEWNKPWGRAEIPIASSSFSAVSLELCCCKFSFHTGLAPAHVGLRWEAGFPGWEAQLPGPVPSSGELTPSPSDWRETEQGFHWQVARQTQHRDRLQSPQEARWLSASPCLSVTWVTDHSQR